jgi:putative endonuclease
VSAFVYVLRCGDGSLYTGVARDLAARLRQHAAGRASRYTRAHLPVALVWSRECGRWGDALRAEARIKRLPKAEKEALIAGLRVYDPASAGTPFAGRNAMPSASLTRPPRPRRPPEVVRHVDQLMDAYKQVQAGRRRRRGTDAADSDTRRGRSGR